MSLLGAGTHVLFGQQEWKRTWFSFFSFASAFSLFGWVSMSIARRSRSLAVKRMREKYVRSESRSQSMFAND